MVHIVRTYLPSMSQRVATVAPSSQLEALQHVERRRLLLALMKSSEDDQIPIDSQSLEYDEREDLLISMHHVHLPKLAQLGLIRTDGAGRNVRKGPNFDEIKPLLELLDEHRDELPADWV